MSYINVSVSSANERCLERSRANNLHIGIYIQIID